MGPLFVIKNIAAPINNIGITESNVSLDILLTNIVPILDPIKQAFGAEEAVAKLARQIPMNKIGDTDDVSYAILYLASDESKFMTGTEIVLDGGLSAM